MRTLTTRSLHDILVAVEPRGWLVPNLIPADGITLLTAAPKVGKTFLACQVAVAVREGLHLLGFGTCTQQKVLYLDRESSQDELRERFDRLNGDAKNPRAVEFCDEPLQLADAGDIDALIACVREKHYGLVVIDTLASYITGIDENDAGSVSRPLDGLRRLQRATGIAVLVIAHAPKSGSKDAVAAKTRGSNAITATASTLLVLNPRAGGKASLEVQPRMAKTSSVALSRRADGFWTNGKEGGVLEEAA